MRLIDADALIESLGINPEDCPGCPEPEWLEELADVLALAPTVERKKGKWKDRKVFDTKGTGIVEMQSAKCSKCGRYHTTPYLYFFDDFNFCPNCGADMRGDADE